MILEFGRFKTMLMSPLQEREDQMERRILQTTPNAPLRIVKIPKNARISIGSKEYPK
jgi:hypothetical protein